MTVFTDKDAAAEKLSRRLAKIPALAENCACDPDDAVAQLVAAEREVSRRLGVLLEPTWVFAEGDTDAEIAARNPALPYLVDPGYDYRPDSFEDNAWGFMVLRQRPVIEVASFRYVYVPQDQLFDVPLNWLRVDKKYGHVQVVPTASTSSVPLYSYLLSTLGGNRPIPHLVRVRYRAGIQDIATEYPDLLQFIYRIASLNYLRDTFPASSESISGDGLSQNRSFDLKAYTDTADGAIEQEYRRWITHFNGAQLVIV